MSIGGVERTLRGIGKARTTDAINIAAGLQKIGNIVLRKALIYVPVEYGDLRSTGAVLVTGKGFGARVTVSFGGISDTGRVVDYAKIVHECDDHEHAGITCAKYLEKAVRESKGTATSLLQRQIKEVQ